MGPGSVVTENGPDHVIGGVSRMTKTGVGRESNEGYLDSLPKIILDSIQYREETNRGSSRFLFRFQDTS